MEWQAIKDPSKDTQSHRLQVPGGWLVRTIFHKHTYAGQPGGSISSSATSQIAQTFIPDPNHEWRA